jgi:hypothetical protein
MIIVKYYFIFHIRSFNNVITLLFNVHSLFFTFKLVFFIMNEFFSYVLMLFLIIFTLILKFKVLFQTLVYHYLQILSYLSYL